MGGPPEAVVRTKFVSDIGIGFGPFIMGYCFNMLLLGALLAQVWHWHKWTAKERTFIKVIVYWVLLGSIASSAFVMIWEYNLFVTGYGKFAQFVDSSFFSWLPVIDETVVFACQIFNLERSYRLNGRKILVLILIVPFMLATAGFIISRKIITLLQGSPEFDVTQVIQPPPQACLFTNVVTDVLLTLSIAYGLWKAKTGWEDTDNLLKRIIVYTIKSQLPPAIAASVTAAQFAANSKTTLVFLYMITNSKIPAVMFMAVLNFRFELRRASPTTHHIMSSTAGLVNVHVEYDTDSTKTIHNQMDDIPMLERPFACYDQPSDGNEVMLTRKHGSWLDTVPSLRDGTFATAAYRRLTMAS